LIKELSKLDKQFIKFLFVGGLNTAFGYCIFALFLFIGLHYSLAAFLGTICGILFNFKTTGSLVFKNKNNALIFRFFGVYGVVLILNVIGLKFFSIFSINSYIGGALLILPMAVVSFFLNKRFVFGANSILNKIL